MKRYLITSVFLFFVSLAFSEGLNPSQQKLFDEIFKFLKSEGYSPSVDSDGDIKFKASSRVYYISVDAVNDHPMYICMAAYYEYSDNFTKENILAVMPDMSRKKFLKVWCHEKNYSIRAEIFLTNSYHFTAIFDKMLSYFSLFRSNLSELISEL